MPKGLIQHLYMMNIYFIHISQINTP